MKENEIDPWWNEPLGTETPPTEVKVEIVLDVELFNKIKGNVNEYIINLIKNDNVI